MTLAAKHFTLAILCVALFAGAHLIHLQLNRVKDTHNPSQRFAYLPDGEYLKLGLLGYQRVGADLLWLQVIQAMGERTVSVEAGRWIYRALDVLTTLDPTFVRAYEVGGVALCTLVVLPEESNRLLEKGIRHNPESWMLHFLLGFNYYYEMHDDVRAAEYLGKASQLPGAPDYLPGLTARLFLSGKEPQRAVEFLSLLYQETTDQNLKNFLSGRLEEAIVVRDLDLLQKSIARYEQQYHRPIDRLDDLVTSNILSALPTEPSGATYLYDGTSRKVLSQTFREQAHNHGFRRTR